MHELLRSPSSSWPFNHSSEIHQTWHLEQGLGWEHENRQLHFKYLLGTWTLISSLQHVTFWWSSKPNVNSSLNDIKKFVHDKYVKRKFVDPNEDFDPLTKVKKGISIEKPEKDNGNAKPNNVIDTNPVKPTAPGLKETPKKNQYHTVKESTLNFNK